MKNRSDGEPNIGSVFPWLLILLYALIINCFFNTVKPGLNVSRKDRKHMLANIFLSRPAMAWSSSGGNDHKYRSSTINICS